MVGDFKIDEIPAQDWTKAWRAHFKPVRITPHIVVKPPWEAWDAGSQEIVIDITPRMAFGTGTHESTHLAMELMESHLNPEDHVLDIGTGSGILAIAAVRLGALSVLGVDIDEDALANAEENIRRNGVDDLVEVRHGSIDAVDSVKFDLILANIDRKTLIDLIPQLAAFVRSGTKLILSGILTEEITMIEEILLMSGCRILESRQKGEWTGVAAEVNWL